MADAEFVEFLRDLTRPLGGITFRKMFGGVAIYQDGIIFAAQFDEGLHLKADEQTKGRFEAEGLGPFTYAGSSGRLVQMPYWKMPDRLFDEPDEFVDWCREAIGAARRAEAAKAAKPKRVRKAKTAEAS
jgi:DNA transformation protein and related proteins